MPWEGVDPITWAAKTKDVPRQAVNAFAFSIFNRVVMRTPKDTGAAQQNWLVTINSETHEADPSKRDGGPVLTDGAAVIEKAKGDDKIYIQNNLSYVRKLEVGGYPQNPKNGGPKTVGGFSRQSPHGMIGATMAMADRLWEKAVKAAKAAKGIQ
jgi:hypothetical protein